MHWWTHESCAHSLIHWRKRPKWRKKRLKKRIEWNTSSSARQRQQRESRKYWIENWVTELYDSDKSKSRKKRRKEARRDQSRNLTVNEIEIFCVRVHPKELLKFLAMLWPINGLFFAISIVYLMFFPTYILVVEFGCPSIHWSKWANEIDDLCTETFLIFLSRSTDSLMRWTIFRHLHYALISRTIAKGNYSYESQSKYNYSYYSN